MDPLIHAHGRAVSAEGGFVPVNDQGDAYKFVYPFGWQEVSVTGQVLLETLFLAPVRNVNAHHQLCDP